MKIDPFLQQNHPSERLMMIIDDVSQCVVLNQQESQRKTQTKDEGVAEKMADSKVSRRYRSLSPM